MRSLADHTKAAGDVYAQINICSRGRWHDGAPARPGRDSTTGLARCRTSVAYAGLTPSQPCANITSRPCEPAYLPSSIFILYHFERVFFTQWRLPLSVSLVQRRHFVAAAALLVASDMPWRQTWRQMLEAVIHHHVPAGALGSLMIAKTILFL